MESAGQKANASNALNSPRFFSTRSLHRRDRFDAWREFLRDEVEITPADEPVSDFPADAERWTLGDLTFASYTLVGTPARAWTHHPQIHRDDWCVVLAGSRDPIAGAHLSFRSLARPFAAQGRDEMVLSMHLPRAGRTATEARLLDSCHGMELDPSMSLLLATFMRGLAHSLPGMTQAQADRLAEPARLLLMTCLGSDKALPDALADQAPHDPVPAASLMLQYARQIVARNLAAQDLGPGKLGRELGMSRSKLYRLFEPEGGVAAFIQKERLRRAMELLNAGSGQRPICAIATQVGFSDHSTFSRAFRREFGVTPRDVRENAIAIAAAVGQPVAGCGECGFHHGDSAAGMSWRGGSARS
jgi:AraC-like DNA-binding protein